MSYSYRKSDAIDMLVRLNDTLSAIVYPLFIHFKGLEINKESGTG